MNGKSIRITNEAHSALRVHVAVRGVSMSDWASDTIMSQILHERKTSASFIDQFAKAWRNGKKPKTSA